MVKNIVFAERLDYVDGRAESESEEEIKVNKSWSFLIIYEGLVISDAFNGSYSWVMVKRNEGTTIVVWELLPVRIAKKFRVI